MKNSLRRASRSRLPRRVSCTLSFLASASRVPFCFLFISHIFLFFSSSSLLLLFFRSSVFLLASSCPLLPYLSFSSSPTPSFPFTFLCFSISLSSFVLPFSCYSLPLPLGSTPRSLSLFIFSSRIQNRRDGYTVSAAAG